MKNVHIYTDNIIISTIYIYKRVARNKVLECALSEEQVIIRTSFKDFLFSDYLGSYYPIHDYNISRMGSIDWLEIFLQYSADLT